MRANPSKKATPTTESSGVARTRMALDDAEKREAMIRIAAYSFYERRGQIAGHELEDWLMAEMEVERQLGAKPGHGTPS